MWLIGLMSVILFQTMLWLIATKLGRDDIVDVGWGLSFIILVWSWWPIGQSSWSHLNTWVGTLVAVMATVWGMRLSLHILERFVHSRHEDQRYVDLKARWPRQSVIVRYIRIFLAQALLASIIALPAFVILVSCGGSSWALSSNEITLIWVIASIWIAGFIIETVADLQLRSFLRRRKGDTIMKTGLWRYSRHPNYFGELVQWWAIGGLGVMCAYDYMIVAALAGPFVISYLILFVSGIPPAEARASRRPDWADYKRRTSALIPLPPKS